MSIEILKSQLAADMARPNAITVSAVIVWHDAQCKNAFVAAHERGVHLCVAYDKLRIRAWFFKPRYGVWQYGNDAIACHWPDRDAVIDAFAGIECGVDTVTFNPVEVAA